MPLMPEGVGETVLRLLLALGYGAALGWNREMREKPAGLRTHMLVSLGAATFTIITFKITSDVGADLRQRMDPLRLIEGIIGGIGFLGAGSIIQSRGTVEGITTAATIWVAGSVGIACGTGYYLLGLLVLAAALAVLSLVGMAEKRVLGKEGTAAQADSDTPP